jgi:predicted porin
LLTLAQPHHKHNHMETSMKKTWIPAAALLALNGAAQAQSSVTIYGVVDVGLYGKQLAGTARTKNVESGVMETPHLGFRGSEDLGGGLRANFDLSTFMAPDSGGATRGIPGEAFWSRSAWVGVSGSAGALRLGRMSTPNFINNIRFNPFGASSVINPTFLHTYLGSPTQPMVTGSGATDSGWSNSLGYTSPTLGGAVVALQAAPSEGTSSGRRVGGSLAWTGAQLAAMLSFDKVSRAALAFPLGIPTLPGAVPPFTASDFSTVQLGMSFELPVVKLFGQLARTEITGTRPGPPGEKTIALRTLQLGLAAPIGSGRVLLSAAHTSKEQTLVADQSRTTTTLGYDHHLSKRTDVYTVLMSDKVSELSRGTGYALGIRHRF